MTLIYKYQKLNIKNCDVLQKAIRRRNIRYIDVTPSRLRRLKPSPRRHRFQKMSKK